PGAELAAELETIRATLRAAGPAADARTGRTTGSDAGTAEAGARVACTTATGAGATATRATEADARAVRTTAAGARTARTAPAEAAKAAPPAETPVAPPGARDRTAVAQTALLSALVAGTPAPERFDHRRLRVQSRALAAKRAGVVAKVAPELPEILGDGYRAAFLAYA
ncbi:endonuclease, partial [Streptomyces sp. DSM 41528]|nr:endonuclease [Streptomyces sp. DSM 41528]